MPSALSTRPVFVYGTLRRGQERDIERLRPAALWRGKASVSGALFQLGLYPGLRLGPDGQVQGEVYDISPALEDQLDVIEEVAPQANGEYVKREVLVQLETADGSYAPLLCLVYEATAEVTQGKPRIRSGDWAEECAKPTC